MILQSFFTSCFNLISAIFHTIPGPIFLMIHKNALSQSRPTRPITKIPYDHLVGADICWASRIRYPRPFPAAIISAPIIARQLYPRPIRIPTKISGSAQKSLILKKLAVFDRPQVFPTSKSFLSQERRPLRMFINIGKKDASTIMMIFDVSPIPNQRIKRAIRLIGGTFLINST